MVRLCLSPGSIEQQFIKKIKNKYDEGQLQHVLAPTGAVFRVGLCEDGHKPGSKSSMGTVKAGLRDLYTLWGFDVPIEVVPFSFVYASLAEMQDLLQSLDLFFFRWCS